VGRVMVVVNGNTRRRLMFSFEEKKKTEKNMVPRL
jgi:hypothetical protein